MMSMEYEKCHRIATQPRGNVGGEETLMEAAELRTRQQRIINGSRDSNSEGRSRLEKYGDLNSPKIYKIDIGGTYMSKPSLSASSTPCLMINSSPMIEFVTQGQFVP